MCVAVVAFVSRSAIPSPKFQTNRTKVCPAPGFDVDASKCTGCLTCARTCPFSIPQIRADLCGVGGLGGAAWIDPARCQGCGTCTAECPARAIQLKHYTDEEIRVAVGAWEAPLPVPGGD